jgi:hypothetical protein
MDEQEKEECPVFSIPPLAALLGPEALPIVFSLPQHESRLENIREWSLSCDEPDYLR